MVLNTVWCLATSAKYKCSVYPHQYYAYISQIMTPTVKLPYQQDAKLANHRGVFPMITLLCIKHLRCQDTPVHTEWQLTTIPDAINKRVKRTPWHYLQ